MLLDSHSHLYFPEYDPDRLAILKQMEADQIRTITIGTTLETSAQAIQLAEAHSNIWATVGFHPEHFSSDFRYPGEEGNAPYNIEELKKLALSSKKVVGIGETGLDFFRMDPTDRIEQTKARQEQAFREHVQLANELDLPLVIHCRDALGRLAELLRTWSISFRGVVHCFTGTWEEAKPLLDLGLHLSFTGIITFPVKVSQDDETHVHRVIERMPSDRLLIETDSPFLTPIPYRGKRNQPGYVRYVAEKVAELRHLDLTDVIDQTAKTGERLFHFSEHLL